LIIQPTNGFHTSTVIRKNENTVHYEKLRDYWTQVKSFINSGSYEPVQIPTSSTKPHIAKMPDQIIRVLCEEYIQLDLVIINHLNSNILLERKGIIFYTHGNFIWT
jgi:hypothetical protein